MKHPKRQKPTKAERKRIKVKPPRHPMAAEAQALAREVVRTIMQPAMTAIPTSLRIFDAHGVDMATKRFVSVGYDALKAGLRRPLRFTLDTPETKPLSKRQDGVL